jgi:hypothetical protein
MLSFLLDEHISQKVCYQIQSKYPEIQVYSLQNWEGGRYLELDDELLLDLANNQGLTLVTYDLRSIPTILAERAEKGLSHAGVVFIDDKTIKPNNFGLLVRSLIKLWELEKQSNWENRIIFLEAA